MMKKIILFLVFAFVVWPGVSFSASRPDGKNTLYWCQGLTGGSTGYLDSLDQTGDGDTDSTDGTPNQYDLIDGDAVIVVTISGTDGTKYAYVYDADGTDAESSPDVIRPDDYSTSGVWRLSELNTAGITSSGAIEGASVTDGTITLVGDGTITGLSAGGLPNGSILSDDLGATLDLSGKTVTFGLESGDLPTTGSWDMSSMTVTFGLEASDIPDISSTYEAVDAEIVRADTVDTIGADWEWQDGIPISFGNDNDWEAAYDEAVSDRLEFTHDAGPDADVQWDLNDNAADSTYAIVNTDGTYKANLFVEGSATSDSVIVGSTTWDNGSDAIDGEVIADDTIDDDSIDLDDVTLADFTNDASFQTGRLTEGITQQAFTAADATPDGSFGGSSLVRWAATGGVVTITDIDDGDDHSEFTDGDWILVAFDHAATLDLSSNSNMYGHNGEDWTASVGDTALFVWDATNSKWLVHVSSIKVLPSVNLSDDDTPATDGMILKYDNTTDNRYESVADEFTECLYLEDPVAADDLQSIFANKTSRDFELTEIWAESDQTVSFDLQIDDGTPADVNGTDISPSAGEAEDTSLSGDTTLAAGEELDLVITSVANTPTWVSICWTYERR